MEKAGITIIYSMPGLKVHAKVALIVKKNKSGKKARYAYLATGNFNEKTATLYADHGLFTTNKRLTKELDNLFDFFKSRTKNIQFNNLLVAGFNMKDQLLDLITHEIEATKRGDEAFVIVKLNGLDEEEMIRKLYEASQAGVKVQLIVRAGCSLVPGRDGLSENITAHRLVDMYLEHARVYWFCNGSKDKILLSSADWMNRNLNRRIEVGFPIEDEELKMEIKTIINLQLADNIKLTSIGAPCEVAKNESADHRAQAAIHSWLEHKENVVENVVQ
jgi:polyphosphate kinase